MLMMKLKLMLRLTLTLTIFRTGSVVGRFFGIPTILGSKLEQICHLLTQLLRSGFNHAYPLLLLNNNLIELMEQLFLIGKLRFQAN